MSPRINFSTALFRIQRPFIGNPVKAPSSDCPIPLPSGYTNCVISQITGNQINYGAEAMLEGRVFESLMIYSGITVLNPKLTDTGNPRPTTRRLSAFPTTSPTFLPSIAFPG